VVREQGWQTNRSLWHENDKQQPSGANSNIDAAAWSVYLYTAPP